MKKLFLIVIAGCLLGGCAQQVYLKKSPSELVLTSIKSENQKKFGYSFSSKIPDTLTIGNFVFDVNATYISNLKIFMNTKYTVVEGDSSNIEFVLLSCTQTTKNANSGLQNTSNVLQALGGSNGGTMYNNVLLTTEISLKVSVKKGQNVLSEKTIFTTDEYNGDNNNISVAQKSFDQAIGKSIIMIDKFLSSIE
jgi:hypothetical protein